MFLPRAFWHLAVAQISHVCHFCQMKCCQARRKCHNILSSCLSVQRADYLNTFEFLDKLAENLKVKLLSQPKLWSRPLCSTHSHCTHRNRGLTHSDLKPLSSTNPQARSTSLLSWPVRRHTGPCHYYQRGHFQVEEKRAQFVKGSRSHTLGSNCFSPF